MTGGDELDDRQAAFSRTVAELHATAERLERLRAAGHELEADIAATEGRVAVTFRGMAATAARQGRTADAARLARQAEDAEDYSRLERSRSHQDDVP